MTDHVAYGWRYSRREGWVEILMYKPPSTRLSGRTAAIVMSEVPKHMILGSWRKVHAALVARGRPLL